MWCTRWYLPLLLLPLPIAPPFFLVLFLLSLTLHARPCFYCIVLLTALFLSTCYWPPVPIDTPLRTPWSENITTYSDALLSLIPDFPRDKIPSDIPIIDHCWCDLTSGKFFEPYNMTRWEVESIVKLKKELTMMKELEDLQKRFGEMKKKLKERKDKLHEQQHMMEELDGELDGVLFEDALNNNSTPLTDPGVSSASPSKWSLLLDAFFGTSEPSVTKLPSDSQTAPELVENQPDPTPSPPIQVPLPVSPSPLPPVSQSPLPRLRREYDLRPYGFEMVIDLGWSRRRD